MRRSRALHRGSAVCKTLPLFFRGVAAARALATNGERASTCWRGVRTAVTPGREPQPERSKSMRRAVSRRGSPDRSDGAVLCTPRGGRVPMRPVKARVNAAGPGTSSGVPPQRWAWRTARTKDGAEHACLASHGEAQTEVGPAATRNAFRKTRSSCRIGQPHGALRAAGKAGRVPFGDAGPQAGELTAAWPRSTWAPVPECHHRCRRPTDVDHALGSATADRTDPKKLPSRGRVHRSGPEPPIRADLPVRNRSLRARSPQDPARPRSRRKSALGPRTPSSDTRSRSWASLTMPTLPTASTTDAPGGGRGAESARRAGSAFILRPPGARRSGPPQPFPPASRAERGIRLSAPRPHAGSPGHPRDCRVRQGVALQREQPRRVVASRDGARPCAMAASARSVRPARWSCEHSGRFLAMAGSLVSAVPAGRLRRHIGGRPCALHRFPGRRDVRVDGGAPPIQGAARSAGRSSSSAKPAARRGPHRRRRALGCGALCASVSRPVRGTRLARGTAWSAPTPASRVFPPRVRETGSGSAASGRLRRAAGAAVGVASRGCTFGAGAASGAAGVDAPAAGAGGVAATDGTLPTEGSAASPCHRTWVRSRPDRSTAVSNVGLGASGAAAGGGGGAGAGARRGRPTERHPRTHPRRPPRVYNRLAAGRSRPGGAAPATL